MLSGSLGITRVRAKEFWIEKKKNCHREQKEKKGEYNKMSKIISCPSKISVRKIYFPKKIEKYLFLFI